ncbi:MAG: flavin reductase family protein [Gemmatimonadetes bacterium]|jgi:3-hydroxy-9,10-secoandrosta-1,3,5(10)-triene-9,17-dione monooxygenase reductase component|nr:flavin reductase family protein [Gemmatimonadota bacterium]MBP9106747.1 flavin reductase family protein [Gemmatimonadaceae bacterium]MBK7834740.1 flavin reductase family protein [Gemmatimonadota bacterium]MBK8056511.1 flavin reductase family protein [Gemmatimonadota bacterium]MBK9408386.1 flavin reductase family protein [Gemmatimonadota bacterium]
MPLDSDLYRSVLGRFASGVTVVTAQGADGRDHGMTVSAFSSLSLAPPLILVCIDRGASVYAALRDAEWIVVNILSASQEALSRRFSHSDAEARFDGIGFTRAPHGAPILDDVLAHLECRITARHDEGDHTILVAEVEMGAARDERPLLYYRGGYAQLER